MRKALAALTLAAVAGSAAMGTSFLLSATFDPEVQPVAAVVPVPISPLAEQLQIQDCPAEETMDMICVWDSQTGRDFVAVYGEIFWVGTNDDGTLWVDFNHDGEEGYPDA